MSSSSPTSSSSSPALIRVTHPPSISSVRAITPRVRFTINGRKIGLYHLPFLLLAGYFFRECYETSGKPYETALAHHKSQGYEPTEFVDGKLVVKKEDFGTPKKGDKFEVKDEWGEDDGFGEEEEEAKSTGSAAEEKDEARERKSFLFLFVFFFVRIIRRRPRDKPNGDLRGSADVAGVVVARLCRCD